MTCCSLPRVSVKRKSTNLTSLSFTMFITSATVLAIKTSPRRLVRCVGVANRRRTRAGGPKMRTKFSRKHASALPGRRRRRCDATHRCGALSPALAHQFGAERCVVRAQSDEQPAVGAVEQRGVALDAELDVAAPLRVVDARQAEDLDAGELASIASISGVSVASMVPNTITERSRGAGATAGPGSACRAPIRSSARPSPESRERRTRRLRPAGPRTRRSCCTGWG